MATMTLPEFRQRAWQTVASAAPAAPVEAVDRVVAGVVERWLARKQPLRESAKLERCVKDVKAQGDGEPWAICRAALKESAQPIDLPDVRQRDDFGCGPACCSAVLQHFGIDADTPDLYKPLDTDGGGTDPEAMVALLERAGLSCDAQEGMSVADLAAHTAAGRPVICAVQYDSPEGLDSGHYVLVLGVEGEGH